MNPNTNSIDLPLRYKAVFWASVLFFVLVQAWINRFFVFGDLISYCDMGDAYLRGDWRMAVNATWSPLFSWLIVAPRHLLTIPIYWEPELLQLVDLFIFVLVSASFEVFLSVLVRHRAQMHSDDNAAALPTWALRVVAYAIFLYSLLAWLPPSESAADICVEAVVFLAAALLIRMRAVNMRWSCFASFGLVLGIGYLAKAVMFPLAFVYLAIGLLASLRSRRALAGTLLASAVFLLISVPFILALSQAKSRFTFGDSGKIVYARYVSHLTKFHWQGVEPGFGVPVHPTRRVLDDPPLYEFATPVRGSYPVWYDPSYWWEGMVIHLNLRQQALVLLKSLRFYSTMIIEQAEFPACFLSLFLLGPSLSKSLRNLVRQWHLLLPSLAALSVYALVYVETRYVAGFAVVAWIGLFAGLLVPQSQVSEKFVRAVAIALVGIVGLRAVTRTANDLSLYLRDRDARGTNIWWQVADRLHKMSVRPGDKVGAIEYYFDTYWARVAGVSIVSEIPDDSADRFWASDANIKNRVYQAFAKTGAKAIVSDMVPESGPPVGWQRVGGTRFFIYNLALPVGNQ